MGSVAEAHFMHRAPGLPRKGDGGDAQGRLAALGRLGCRFLALRCAALVAVVGVGCGVSRQPSIAAATGRESLVMVARDYREAAGYRDSGTFQGRVGEHVFNSSFETLFVRGVGLRLKIVSRLTGVAIYWYVDGLFAEQSARDSAGWYVSNVPESELIRVLCGLRGTTDYASTVAPAMLLGFSFAKSPREVRPAESSCAGCRSFFLQPNPVESLRVDTMNGLMVQWEVTATVKGQTSTGTLRFRPRILSSVADLESATNELRAVPWSSPPR